MLASEGLKAMLHPGGWATIPSAFPYTPADELEMQMMGNLRIDGSDDEL